MTTQKTTPTSAIKLVAIWQMRKHFLVTLIIALCVFAGCKDDEKPDPIKPQWDSKSLEGTQWSWFSDSEYPDFSFENGRVYQLAGTSQTIIYDTTYSYEYPNVHFHSVLSSPDEIYMKGNVFKNLNGQWCMATKCYLSETDEPLTNVDVLLWLISFK